jgi:hypothetical protein
MPHASGEKRTANKCNKHSAMQNLHSPSYILELISSMEQYKKNSKTQSGHFDRSSKPHPPEKALQPPKATSFRREIYIDIDITSFQPVAAT